MTATGVNKVYDGTTTATVTLTDDRVPGDDVTDTYTTATFADKNVEPAKAVSVSGISISGADAGNYTCKHHGLDDGRHHEAAADGDRDGRQQGLRRHDDGDRDALRQPRRGRRVHWTATPPRRSRTRTWEQARP